MLMKYIRSLAKEIPIPSEQEEINPERWKWSDIG